MMLSNYIRVAARNLSQNRFFTLLNIVGLAIGLATAVLILLWVRDELSFDRFHPHADRIYRESTHLKLSDRMLHLATVPAPHAAYALREIPEVENAVRVVLDRSALVKQGTLTGEEKKGAFVDTSFFQVFSANILAGNPQQPFTDANAVVLTESLARKYFGGDVPLAALPGQVLHIDDEPVVVSAIMKDYPGNTAFQYDYVRPYQYLKEQFQPNEFWKSREEDWGNCDDATYFLLKPGANTEVVARKLTDLTHTHNKLDRGTFYQLQPLDQIHLYGPDGSATGAQTVQIFGLIALFILIIACINYINLATAKASKRAKEVGLRKAIGAQRHQLIAQFMTESGLVFLLSSGLALVFTYQLLPFCNKLTDKNLQLGWTEVGIMAGVLGVALVLSSIYPALILSAFNPLRVMKGQLHSGGNGQARLRKGLVIIQFTCSSILLLAMLIIGRQLDFIRTKNLGYDRENIFQINLSDRAYQNKAVLLQTLKNSAGVLDVTAASGNIMESRVSTGDVDWDGKTNNQLIKISPISVAPDFLSFFHISLSAGGDFSGTPADATAFIINETAAAQMGLTHPVGQRLKLWDTEGHIIGVVKDFHFASLHSSIQPAIFYVAPERQGTVYVKTTGAMAPKSLAAAESAWKQLEPSYPFNYAFMDDTFDRMYHKEAQSNLMFRAFAGIALLISCLGLFGLSAFTVEQRTKEIGIRKVLGAGIPSILGLLTRDFITLVMIAFLVAAPAAWFLMQQWLINFAYRIELQWWMFAVAGMIALLVAFLTVSGQAMKAALANPVKALKSE